MSPASTCLNGRIPSCKGLRVLTPGDNTAQLLLQLYFIYFDIDFLHAYFFTKFLSFADEHRATPVQDTAQRRHRRRRAAGTRSKDSFQIKTLRKPFLLSLVAHILRILNITESDADVIGILPRQNDAHTWTLRDHHQGRYSARYML